MATSARSRYLEAIQPTASGQPIAAGPASRERDLADLRYFWGGVYRVTWQGRFRATHIATGEAIEADSAPAMRELLLDRQRRPGRVVDSLALRGP